MNFRQGKSNIPFFLLGWGILLIVSCGSSKELAKNYVYFQGDIDTVATLSHETVIQPNDVLSIQVSSRTMNQEQAAVFNSPANAEKVPYQVGFNGTIDFPILGAIKASGFTKKEFQDTLIQQLTEYVKNPSVLIKFLHFNINVLGEVRSPGTQKFNVDRVTIIDALGAAGDLTDFAKRDEITIIRQNNGKKIFYSIDLGSRKLFNSPVYVLQPNDIVYVSPNKNKLKGLNVDPETQRKTGLLMSLTSIAISLATLLLFSL